MGKTKKDAWDIAKGALGSLFALAIIALPGVLAWVKKMPWFLVPISVVFMTGSVLWTINQWKQWRKGRNVSKYSDKKIEKIIREWINIPGVSMERKLPDAQIHFKYLMTDTNGLTVNITRDKKNPAIIQLVARVKTVLEDIPLKKAEQKRTAGRIGIEMARLGIGYKFDGSPDPLDSVLLFDLVIIDDSLTELHFRQRILFVIRAMVLALETSKRTAEDLGLTP